MDYFLTFGVAEHPVSVCDLTTNSNHCPGCLSLQMIFVRPLKQYIKRWTGGSVLFAESFWEPSLSIEYGLQSINFMVFRLILISLI